MAASEEFKQNWLECQDEYGKNIESGDIAVLELNEVDTAVTLPGVKFTAPYDPNINNQFQEYVHIPMQTFKTPIDDLAAQVSTATSDLTTLKQQTETARQDAITATAAAQEATVGAEKVNATMNGMVITVTDRNGNKVTKNIGFDMVGTYPSVAAMNADAANVEEGKFVIIATDDPTAADNAKLYVRNSNPATSASPFSYCADLDQASAAAWADWLENKKPEIDGRIATADADHTRAVSDHSTAASDHTTATSDHTISAQQQATFEQNEAQRQQDFEDAEEQRIATMVITEAYVDFDTMELVFLQGDADNTDYTLDDGYLDIDITYDE